MKEKREKKEAALQKKKEMAARKLIAKNQITEEVFDFTGPKYEDEFVGEKLKV